jgi:hypothetical protein
MQYARKFRSEWQPSHSHLKGPKRFRAATIAVGRHRSESASGLGRVINVWSCPYSIGWLWRTARQLIAFGHPNDKYFRVSTRWSIVAREAARAGAERKSDNSNGRGSAYLSGDLAWLIPAARKPKTIASIRPVRGYEQHLRGGLGREHGDDYGVDSGRGLYIRTLSTGVDLQSDPRGFGYCGQHARGSIGQRSPPLEFIQQVAHAEKGIEQAQGLRVCRPKGSAPEKRACAR